MLENRMSLITCININYKFLFLDNKIIPVCRTPITPKQQFVQLSSIVQKNVFSPKNFFIFQRLNLNAIHFRLFFDLIFDIYSKKKRKKNDV